MSAGRRRMNNARVSRREVGRSRRTGRSGVRRTRRGSRGTAEGVSRDGGGGLGGLPDGEERRPTDETGGLAGRRRGSRGTSGRGLGGLSDGVSGDFRTGSRDGEEEGCPGETVTRGSFRVPLVGRENPEPSRGAS
ncbi:hypothetical protein M758_UG225000 [Ceratodon purpureus]|nr:hypothetical protein M758_UG225000 [Ceratodon purpureus]